MVVVAFPPKTKAMLLPPFGNKARLFVEVANLLLPSPPTKLPQPNCPENHWRNCEPLQVERPKPLRKAPYRFVELAVVEKKFVVVAEVLVELMAVKF